MAKARRETQTTPQGHEIPIPSRDDFMRDLGKLSQPQTVPPASKRRKGKPSAGDGAP